MLLAVIDDRNRMVHDYSEQFAEALFGRIKAEYVSAFRALQEQLRVSDEQPASG
jgi:hypothetical protein